MGLMDKILGRETNGNLGQDIDPQTGNFVKAADPEVSSSASPLSGEQVASQSPVSLTELEQQIEPIINPQAAEADNNPSPSTEEASFTPPAESSSPSLSPSPAEVQVSNQMPAGSAFATEATPTPEQAASEISTDNMQIFPGTPDNSSDEEFLSDSTTSTTDVS